MRRKTLKGAALAALVGMLPIFGGCLSFDGTIGRVLLDGALYTGWELVLDGGVQGFDLGTGDTSGG